MRDDTFGRQIPNRARGTQPPRGRVEKPRRLLTNSIERAGPAECAPRRGMKDAYLVSCPLELANFRLDEMSRWIAIICRIARRDDGDAHGCAPIPPKRRHRGRTLFDAITRRPNRRPYSLRHRRPRAPRAAAQRRTR